jgi:hypothetical protein
MKKQKPYAELVAEAEKAVALIKDPELRRVAFERILDDLLSGSGDSSIRDVSLPKPKGRSRKGLEPAARKTTRRGPKGYVLELVEDGFFRKPKTIAEVKAELANRGHHIARTSLSGPLQSLCQDKKLRRHKAKIKGKGKKETFNYSEW